MSDEKVDCQELDLQHGIDRGFHFTYQFERYGVVSSGKTKQSSGWELPSAEDFLFYTETTMRTKMLGFVLLSLALVSTVMAQSTTGSILGDVTDSSGARLPGATVRLVNEGTGATREVLTNEVGSYRFDALQPVEYTVTVEFQGFAKATRKAIKVPVASQVKA